jgi:AraC-like DNA-binding protein
VPVLTMGGLFLWRYYLLPVEEKIAVMVNLDFMYSDFMAWVITTWHVSVIAYGSASLLMLRRYREELHQHYANLEGRTRGWLLWVISGFVLLASWKLAVHLIGESIPGWLANSLGITSNYLTFVFVMSLVIISVRYAHLFAGLTVSTSDDSASHTLQDENIERIRQVMEQEQFYLESDVTLEALAKRVSLPERTASRILNQHFGMNFFEFINSYRVEQTKRLLTSEQYADWTIMEVLLESGFTSKSTFNAIFKKQVDMTPSQYRKRSTQKCVAPGVLSEPEIM